MSTRDKVQSFEDMTQGEVFVALLTGAAIGLAKGNARIGIPFRRNKAVRAQSDRTIKAVENNPYPLVGSAVKKTTVLGKSDVPDWSDLMETVKMFCPAWPERDPRANSGSDYRL